MTLLDPLDTTISKTGELADFVKVTAGVLEEIGSSGLRMSGGYVLEERLAKLRGRVGRENMREMVDNDPVVGAGLLAIDLIARKVDWRVEEGQATDERAIQFTDDCRLDMNMSWADTMSGIMTMVPFGWAYCETVYKKRLGWNVEGSKRSRFDDGKFGWRKWPLRMQDSLIEWVFDPETGSIKGMHQDRSWQGLPPVVIPIERSLLFRTVNIGDNPEGRSAIRNAWTSYWNKKRIMEIEGIGLERDLAGLPVGWVPMRWLSDVAKPNEKAALTDYKEVLANIRTDEQSYVLMPLAYDDKGNKLFDLTLLSTGGQRQFDIDPVIARYDQRIAMTFLADFLLLGHEAVGSFALGSAKIDLFAASLEARLDSVRDIVNSYAIPRLLDQNGMDPALAPSLEHGELSTVDLGEIGDFIFKLSQSGATLWPNQALLDHLMEVAHLPEISDEVLQEQEQAAADAQQASIDAAAAMAAAKQPVGPDGKPVPGPAVPKGKTPPPPGKPKPTVPTANGGGAKPTPAAGKTVRPKPKPVGAKPPGT